MLKGFKEFILRGNLVELAVAFIIGGACLWQARRARTVPAHP